MVVSAVVVASVVFDCIGSFMRGGCLGLMSCAGYFYNNDILWLFHQNPYMNSAYGNGSYFHFLNNMDVILGKPLLLLAIVGLLILIYYSLNKNKRKIFSDQIKAEWLLLVLPFITYFLFHSFLWGKGIGGSLGLLRVVAGVAPLIAIISLKGFNLFLSYLEEKKIFKYAVMIIILAVVIYMPFRLNVFPIKVDMTGALIKEAAQWVKENNTSGERTYYYDISFQPEFSCDPFSCDSNRKFFQLFSFPYDDIEINSLLIWDAHFGGGDNNVPIEKLMESKEFRLLKKFEPSEEIYIMNRKYEICIFEKIAKEKVKDK